MTYLLDTNTCIKLLNGRSEPVNRRIRSLHFSEVAICSVVKAELLYGAAKSVRREENFSKLQRFYAGFASLPFDDGAAETYGWLRSRLEAAGTPIGPNDLLIGAIALSNRRVLVTHNTREFGRIPGLVLEDWESDPLDP
jgi:tRNA(fMet)-specific endonuclease VapC